VCSLPAHGLATVTTARLNYGYDGTTRDVTAYVWPVADNHIDNHHRTQQVAGTPTISPPKKAMSPT
jgi:hypothetical protein